MKTFSTRNLALCALFAALTAVCSWISIPIGPVPINLALLPVLLCGALLGPVSGCLSIGCYLLLGLAGVPVFASFRGGAGALLGPTGGYLIGYLLCVAISGLGRGKNVWQMLLFMVLGIAACYALGTAWFVHLTGKTLAVSLSACVIPFLPGDAAKTALALLLARRLKKPLHR